MEPEISNISYDNDKYKFTLSGVNTSIANGIRRTILMDVPIVGIFTETYDKNQCSITKNTTRLHNEILKQRLSCIPIHITDLDVLPGNYELVLDKINDTDNNIIITTEDFQVRSKSSGNYLQEEEVHKLFPKNDKTGMYIDFARLRCKIDDNIPGEQLSLTADFSIQTAKDNSMFNVVSICTYGNTMDEIKINKKWEEQENKLRSEQLTDEEIKIQKKNFYILDAQKYYKNNSFDFIIQSIGIYSNKELVKKSCSILENKFIQFILSIENDNLPIVNSDSSIENCYDIILENEDYTMGNILEFIMYEKFYEKEQVLTYCGFNKIHPHDIDSILRLGFNRSINKQEIGKYLILGCNDIIEIMKNIRKLF
jgi:DNA-directed RNA polymerase II subunit RPB3|tara:strand:- start:3545 stop:4648 length:1104 start_codon:yes stop_codon:yes gene_type:complete